MAEPSEALPPIPPLFPVAIWTFKTLFKLFTRVHVSGQENLPQGEAVLLCPNHLTYFDPPLVGSFFGQPAAVMVASKYDQAGHPFQWVDKLADVIFVRRGEVDRQALRAALSRLKGGRSLGIAPEGTRSKDGTLQHPREGVAYMAQKTGVRIVPVAVWGVEGILPALKRLRRADVYLVFGKPYQPFFDPTLPRQEQLAAVSETLMLKIAEMLPPAYRGVYAEKVPADHRLTSASTS